MDLPDWLPPLVYLADHGGDWNRYVEALYAYYRQDFCDSQPMLNGRRVARRVTPVDQGKEACFWHLISEGRVESQRLPDPRRCERIRWPRPIVERAGDPPLKVWENRRGRDRRLCIWFEEADYLVVLVVRSGYYLLLTAYPVTHPHTRRKLQKEHSAYTKANAALS